MRNAALILTFGVCAVALQGSLLRTALLGSVVPDFVLVLSVYLGLYHQRVGGVACAFVLGYLLDAFSGAYLGENAFATTFVFFLAYMLSRWIWIEGALPVALVVFAGAVLKTCVVAALAAAFSAELPGRSVRGEILGGGIAAMVSPFLFVALERSRRWLGSS